MEQLTQKEFNHLDKSFKELIPQERILFSDSKIDEISSKINRLNKNKPYTVSNTLIYLLSQYTVFSKTNEVFFANERQIEFIDLNPNSNLALLGKRVSGKSYSLLQKALYEKLKNPKNNIIIIAPSVLHADILKSKLIQIIEHANIKLLDLQIFTPEDIIKIYYKKMKKPITKKLSIDANMLKKDFLNADTIFCDDIHLMDDEFKSFLYHLKNKTRFICVDYDDNSNGFLFDKSYASDIYEVFYTDDELSKAIRIIYNLYQEKEKSIILYHNRSNKIEKDIQTYIGEKVSVIDTELKLYNQNAKIYISKYKNNIPLHADFVVFIDCCQTDIKILRDITKTAMKKSIFISKEKCENLKRILS
jgi:hypothetical protein